jgi:hypothetical protein
MRRTIIVSDSLVVAPRYLHCVKGGYLGRREVVQGSVDVPSIEASVAFRRVLRGNLGLMETRVLGVLQLGFGETFVVVNSTVSDKLNLGNPGDRLKVRMKDRLGVLLGFVVAVAVDIALRVKSLNGEGVITAIRPGVRHSICRTFVRPYCSSGGRSTSLKSNTSCWRTRMSKVIRGASGEQHKPCTAAALSL